MNSKSETSTPPALVVRPTGWISFFSDFGAYIGIREMAFDDENSIVLQIDAHRLTIEYLGELTGLLLTATVGEGDT